MEALFRLPRTLAARVACYVPTDRYGTPFRLDAEAKGSTSCRGGG